MEDKITKGQRELFLYNKAAQLVAEGATFDQVKATLEYINSTRCEPPVSPGIIRKLLKTVQKWIDKRSKIDQHL